MKDIQVASPLVSIVVPCYNHEQFVTQCIDSIMAQTYRHFELIVIDDGSSDGSREILTALAERYLFTLIFQDNIGLSNTLNRGFKEFSKGDLLTFCATDDYWYPYKLEEQVRFLEQHPHIPMVFGQVTIVNEKDEILNKDSDAINATLRGGNIFSSILFQEFHPPVNYMYRRWAMEELGFYNAGVWAEDFDMNCRMAEKYEIGYIPKPLFFYRKGVASKKKMLTFNTIQSHRDTINRFRNTAFYYEAIKRWHYRNFLWYAAYRETKLFAFKNLIKSGGLIVKHKGWKSLLFLLLKYR
jgi:alpha-1,3-rhamnosyltransferase